jgi:DNA-binding NarL/FixJ family response regulator
VEHTRVIIVDDHPMVRQGVRDYLNRAPDIKVVADLEEAADLEAALEEHRPDLLLLDLIMDPGFDPLKTVKWLQRAYPDLKIVILSAHDEARWLKLMMDAGVPGYIHKTERPSVLLEGIRKVMDGGQWYSHRLLQAFADEYGHDSALNPHEQLILQKIADGKETKEVAGEMSLSERTVRGYISNVIKKLGARSRAGAVAEALRRGLIE